MIAKFECFTIENEVWHETRVAETSNVSDDLEHFAHSVKMLDFNTVKCPVE